MLQSLLRSDDGLQLREMGTGVAALEIDDYFADGARFDQRVCGRDVGGREALIVEQGLQPAGVG